MQGSQQAEAAPGGPAVHALTGVVSFPLLRLSKAVNERGFKEKTIRPPGTVAEPKLLARCDWFSY